MLFFAESENVKKLQETLLSQPYAAQWRPLSGRTVSPIISKAAPFSPNERNEPKKSTSGKPAVAPKPATMPRLPMLAGSAPFAPPPLAAQRRAAAGRRPAAARRRLRTKAVAHVGTTPRCGRHQRGEPALHTWRGGRRCPHPSTARKAEVPAEIINVGHSGCSKHINAAEDTREGTGPGVWRPP